MSPDAARQPALPLARPPRRRRRARSGLARRTHDRPVARAGEAVDELIAELDPASPRRARDGRARDARGARARRDVTRSAARPRLGSAPRASRRAARDERPPRRRHEQDELPPGRDRELVERAVRERVDARKNATPRGSRAARRARRAAPCADDHARPDLAGRQLDRLAGPYVADALAHGQQRRGQQVQPAISRSTALRP